MYIINGIAYAGKPVEILGIEHVKILEDRILLLTFNNGEKRIFDTAILNGPAFEPLKEDKNFNTASVEDGAVIWMNGEIDCAPEYMYKHSYQYDEVYI